MITSFTIIVMFIYFLPAMVAKEHKHPMFASIAFFNATLGWTLVGWVICMAMALEKDNRGEAYGR